jgi:hypothetical protein
MIEIKSIFPHKNNKKYVINIILFRIKSFLFIHLLSSRIKQKNSILYIHIFISTFKGCNKTIHNHFCTIYVKAHCDILLFFP